MKIAMFTNTYLPHVGGVARSVKTLEDACRKVGHEVRIVAPEFDGAEESPNVLRVPAIQHFNGSDFCVRIPFPTVIRDFMDDFKPDLVHSHHPFLLGDAALREAWKMQVPIVFTHHTLYERYTHYVPLDSPALKRAAVQLSVGYCNLCDQVIAPSESIAKLLRERGVGPPIETIPTGIDTRFFASGDGRRVRQKLGIPMDAKVIGHVGRLAYEKNLSYLAEAVVAGMKDDRNSIFLLIGSGEARDEVLRYLRRELGEDRAIAPGSLAGADLADAYEAMDVFLFASQTETQGLVLAEAMAAGLPVVALDGPGVREIVNDKENGRLLAGSASSAEFAEVLREAINDEDRLYQWAKAARVTARDYDTSRCARMMIASYQKLIEGYQWEGKTDPVLWDRLLAGIEIEWDLLVAKVSAAAAAVIEPTSATERL